MENKIEGKCKCGSSTYEDNKWFIEEVAHGYLCCPWCGCHLHKNGWAEPPIVPADYPYRLRIFRFGNLICGLFTNLPNGEPVGFVFDGDVPESLRPEKIERVFVMEEATDREELGHD